MRARWLKIDWSGPLTAGWPLATGGIVPRAKAVWLDERDGFIRRLTLTSEQWARANPAIGSRVSEQAVKNAFNADPDQEQTP